MPLFVAKYQQFPTATITRIAASASSVQLLAANPKRRWFLIHNSHGDTGGTQVLFVNFGAAASLAAGAEAFHIRLSPGGDYVYQPINYGWLTCAVFGIWAAADVNGEALITEVNHP